MSDNIVQQHPIIEALFALYKDAIGNDYEKYRNHVYRIFNYALYLSKNEEAEKYAIAAFFHDVAIWTHHTFDYLQPSIDLANAYLAKSNKTYWSEEIALMIDNHHKTTAYKGSFEITVNIFRKADWTDVSLDFMRFEIPAEIIKEAKKQFPYKNFHFFLARLFYKNLFQHPLKPLPMFKK